MNAWPSLRAGSGDLAAIRFAVGDGELTQDLLYRPPIERKLSDEPSSNRLDTILADPNSDCHQPHDFALPLPMPLVMDFESPDAGKNAILLAPGPRRMSA
jgi:hypothetical protein